MSDRDGTAHATEADSPKTTNAEEPGQTIADTHEVSLAQPEPTLASDLASETLGVVVEVEATAGSGAEPTRSRRPTPILAGYEIERELGRGSMGVVYRGRELRLNRPCALKMILAGSHASPEVLLRFLAEAEAVARLQHPNIVQIHHIGEADGLPYFELEFLPGGSLDQHLDGTPWDPRRAAILVEALARGIHEAHRNGIVHRDVKPANVLLTSDGSPKLSDFGLAKLLNVESGLTRTESILGTPSYMSPEQADGRARDVGPASDVYALGAILYELLVGRPPFRAATTLETLDQVKNSEPVAPGRLVPRISRDIETIAMVCLRKEPDRRFASAEALAADLKRFLDGRPILARPTGPVNRAWRWGRRNPAISAAIGLAVIGLLAISGLSTTLAIAKGRSVDAEKKTVAALRVSSEIQKKSAEQLRIEAAKLAFERGLTLIERREGSAGLLWLAKALEVDPDDQGGLRHAIGIAFARAEREQVGRLRFGMEHATTDDRFGPGDPARIASLGARMKAIGADTPQVVALAYHPDGRHAIAGYRDGTLQAWDLSTGKAAGPPWNIHSRVTDNLAFLDGGRTVMTVGGLTAVPSKRCEVRSWDWETRKEIGTAQVVNGVVLAIRPDGRALAVRDEAEDLYGSTIRVVDIETLKPLGPPMSHPYATSVATFDSDGKRLLTADAPQMHSGVAKARLWDVTSGKKLWETEGHGGWHLYDAVFSPDGKLVATGGQDNFLRLWDATDGRAVGLPLEHENGVNRIAFSPDGRTIAAATSMITAKGEGNAEVRLWDRKTGRRLGPDLPHDRGISALAFAADGKTVLAGDMTGLTRLWELPEGPRPGRKVDVIGDSRVAFTPDGKTLLIGGSQCQVRALNIANDQLDGPTIFVGKEVRSIELSPDGRTVGVGVGLSIMTNQFRPGYGAAGLFDRASGKEIGGMVACGTDRVDELAFKPDGKTFLIRDGRSVRTTDVATGKPENRALWLGGLLPTALAMSPDARDLAMGDYQGKVSLGSASGGNHRTPRVAPHQESIEELTYSRDGRFLASASRDKTARVLDPSNGGALGPALHHDASVEAVAFSPDSRILASGGNDRTLRLWDRASGLPLGPALGASDEEINSLEFSPDGSTLAVGTTQGCFLWSVPTSVPGSPAELKLRAEARTGRAIDAHGAVFRLDPKEWQKRIVSSGPINGATGGSSNAADEFHLTDAWKSFAEKNWFAVCWHLDRMRTDRPLTNQTLAVRGLARIRMGREAEGAADIATALLSTDPMELATIGQILGERQQTSDATRFFDRALELAESPREALGLANFCSRAGSLAADLPGGLAYIKAIDRGFRNDLPTARTAGASLAEQLDENPEFAYSAAATALVPVLKDKAATVLSNTAAQADLKDEKLFAVGEILARIGRWDLAVGPLSRWVEEDAKKKLERLHYLAIAQRKARDKAGFEATIAEWQRLKSAQTDQKGISVSIWACLANLFPEWVADREAPIRFAQATLDQVTKAQKSQVEKNRAQMKKSQMGRGQMSKAENNSGQKSVFVALALEKLGIAEYRAGRDDDAIRHLEEKLENFAPNDRNPTWIFLALAYHRKGDLVKSRTFLERLEALPKRDYPPSGSSNFWYEQTMDLLEQELLPLYAEAGIERLRYVRPESLETPRPAPAPVGGDLPGT